MKKVGIITIHKSPNYGACLQAYALYTYIRQQGADCEIMDVHRPVHKDYIYERNYSFFRNNPFSLDKKIKKIVNRLLGRKVTSNPYLSQTAEQRFEEFNTDIRYSRIYNRLSDLYKNPPIYDVYISGSDQLWNPVQPYCLEPYFLTFAPEGKIKISYAASIGITELTEIEKKCFKKWLDSYHAVSVREKQGKKLLDSFLENKKVVMVADPTFLLDMKQWKALANYPAFEVHSIVVFLLSYNQQLVDYAIRLGKESGRKVVFLKTKALITERNCQIDNEIGPKEFLGYLGRAGLVITDSFHCTVFSLLMGAENFYTYISPTSKRGSRITDLLETFGLENHLIPTDFSLTFEQLQQNKINHERVNALIVKEQNKARHFLDKWIK